MSKESDERLLDLQERMFAKAAMFDEMRMTLLTAGMGAALDARQMAEKLKLIDKLGVYGSVIKHNAERFDEMKSLVERAAELAGEKS